MFAIDDSSSHIQTINEMVLVLANLGNPISETMILSKILSIVLLLPSQMFLYLSRLLIILKKDYCAMKVVSHQVYTWYSKGLNG
jgi:hypothetical protein